MGLLTQLNEELGMTIVMVTHERALAEQYAQRMLFMSDGKLVGAEITQHSAVGMQQVQR